MKNVGQITLGKTTYDVLKGFGGADDYVLQGPKADLVLRGFLNRPNLFVAISFPSGNEKRLNGNRVYLIFNEAGELVVKS